MRVFDNLNLSDIIEFKEMNKSAKSNTGLKIKKNSSKVSIEAKASLHPNTNQPQAVLTTLPSYRFIQYVFCGLINSKVKATL